MEARLATLDKKLDKANKAQTEAQDHLDKANVNCADFLLISKKRDDHRSEQEVQWLAEHPDIKVF